MIHTATCGIYVRSSWFLSILSLLLRSEQAWYEDQVINGDERVIQLLRKSGRVTSSASFGRDGPRLKSSSTERTPEFSLWSTYLRNERYPRYLHRKRKIYVTQRFRNEKWENLYFVSQISSSHLEQGTLH